MEHGAIITLDGGHIQLWVRPSDDRSMTIGGVAIDWRDLRDPISVWTPHVVSVAPVQDIRAAH